MFEIFKAKKMNGKHADQIQKDQSLDRIVRAVERQAEEAIKDIRRARERRMLREALGDSNGDS